MLETAILTTHALLTVQLEQDVTGIRAVVQMKPEDHPAFHRGPTVATLKDKENRGKGLKDYRCHIERYRENRGKTIL